MNKMKWPMILILVAAVVLAVMVIMNRQASQTELAGPDGTGEGSMPTASEEAAPEPLIPEPVSFGPVEHTAPVRETKALKEGDEPQEVVRARPEQVLATVNGVPITLQDLAAVPNLQRGAERTISASLYDSLLERAVVREVAVQAAEAKGIELSPEQQAQLEKMKKEMTTTSSEVKDMTMSPERLAFDLRDTQGRMLLVNLAADAGAPSAFVTEEQVKAYYEGHKAEYGELPEDSDEKKWAWRKIDREIRNALVGETSASYQQAYDKVVEDLKAEASIDMTPPETP